MQAVRVLAALAGAVLVLGTSTSGLASLVVPGARAGRLMRVVDALTDRAFRFLCRPLPGYRQRHRVLAYHGPVVLATLLGCWLAAYLAGFGLLLWPAVGGLGGALREG